MNRTMLVSLLLLSSATAGADELYQRRRKPPASVSAYDWSGVYFGIHLDSAQQPATVNSFVQTSTANYDAGSPYGSLNLNSRGVLGGIQFGYNHQFGTAIIGFEGDGSFGGVKGSKTVTVPGIAQIDAKYSSKDTTFASLRGRLGFAADNLMIYGTFGGAIRTNEATRTQYATTLAQYASTPANEAADYSTTPQFSETSQSSQTGLALGAGIEYAAGMGWSFYASYIATRWGKTAYQTPKALDSVFSYTPTSTANGRDNHVDATTRTFRLGVNYKL